MAKKPRFEAGRNNTVAVPVLREPVDPTLLEHTKRDLLVLMDESDGVCCALFLSILGLALRQIAEGQLLQELKQFDGIKNVPLLVQCLDLVAESHIAAGKASPAKLLAMFEEHAKPVLMQLVAFAEQAELGAADSEDEDESA